MWITKLVGIIEITKLSGIIGIFIALIGTLLLWISSPSGDKIFGGFVPPERVKKIFENNKKMKVRQNIAIALIAIGSIIQGTVTLIS